MIDEGLSPAKQTVKCVHDGRQVIQEIQTAPSTVLVQEYCWQETTLLETRKSGGWVRTLHQDRLGSVVAATAGGGGTVTIDARTAYDPYGRPVSLPSWSAAGVESIVPFGYTGARWEDLAALDVDVDADGTVESVGLYAMGARWYDAEMGRFLEQDPLGEVAGSNLYAYVDASPVMWVDPSGLFRSPEESKTAWIDRLNPFAMGARAAIRSLAGGRRNARSKTEAGRKYEDAQRFARYMKAWGADFEDQARAQVGMGAVLSLTVMGETSDGKLALMWTVESGATRQPGEVGSSLASEGSGGSGTTKSGTAASSSQSDEGTRLKPDERFLLARVVFAEAGNQSQEGKLALAHVLKNRIDANRKEFGVGVHEVVYKEAQWESVTESSSQWTLSSDGLALNGPNKDAFVASLAAVEQAFEGAAPDPTEGATFLMTVDCLAKGGDTVSRSYWRTGRMEVTAWIGEHVFLRYSR